MSEKKSPVIFHPFGNGAPPIHVAMLNDRMRTSSFLKAISRVVQSGDVVVEIGTGTGILAVAALKAGAKHVYAIEYTPMGRVSEILAQENGVADRLTVLEDHSSRVTLPERADVLITETIGEEPLSEGILEIVSDARRRFLKIEHRMIPSRLKLFAQPLIVPQNQMRKTTFTPEICALWESWYGIRFQSLAEIVKRSSHPIYIDSREVCSWTPICAPFVLADLELTKMKDAGLDLKSIAASQIEGSFNGLLVYSETELADGVLLTTHSHESELHSSWRSAVWIFPEGLPLKSGDHIEVSYRHFEGSTNVSVSRK